MDCRRVSLAVVLVLALGIAACAGPTPGPAPGATGAPGSPAPSAAPGAGKPMGGNLATVGIDDFAQKLVGDVSAVALPRVALVRSLMFNHWYHHRGQLSVYLRLLDVPVPSIYGPSADENPFG